MGAVGTSLPEISQVSNGLFLGITLKRLSVRKAKKFPLFALPQCPGAFFAAVWVCVWDGRSSPLLLKHSRLEWLFEWMFLFCLFYLAGKRADIALHPIENGGGVRLLQGKLLSVFFKEHISPSFSSGVGWWIAIFGGMRSAVWCQIFHLSPLHPFSCVDIWCFVAAFDAFFRK